MKKMELLAQIDAKIADYKKLISMPKEAAESFFVKRAVAMFEGRIEMLEKLRRNIFNENSKEAMQELRDDDIRDLIKYFANKHQGAIDELEQLRRNIFGEGED